MIRLNVIARDQAVALRADAAIRSKCGPIRVAFARAKGNNRQKMTMS
jgi:hypothetical protein